MKVQTHLNELDTIDGYRKRFMDPDLWSTYLKKIIENQFTTTAQSIRPGVTGTYPTFIVDDHWVIKLYGRLFNGLQAFTIERTAADIMRHYPVLPTARLAAWGALDPHKSWHWPYLIFEFVPGIRIAERMDQLSQTARCEFAFWTGARLRAMHQVPLPLPVKEQFPNQENLITRSYHQIVEKHIQWGALPDHLIEQIPEFLDRTSKLSASDVPGHLIHADLTSDHFLGNVENGKWRTNAVIDFGDAMIGHFDYELVALHLDVFKLDKKMLQAFLNGYNLSQADRTTLPKRMMRVTLLHQFNVLEAVPRILMQEYRWGNFDILAEALWGTD